MDADAEHRSHMSTQLVRAADRLGVALLYCVSLASPMIAHNADETSADLLHTRSQHTQIAVALHADARELIAQWEGHWR